MYSHIHPVDYRKISQTIALCSMANFINSADRIIMSIAIIQMTSEFKWTMHSQGWILSSFAVGYMGSMVIGGYAAKWYGGKFVLTLAVLLWSLSTFFTPWFAHSYYYMILFRVVLGIGEGIGLPTIFHIFGHTVPLEEHSRAVGYLVALGSVGQTLSALLCPHLPWRLSFYLFGSLGFAWVVAWILLYRENTRVPSPMGVNTVGGGVLETHDEFSQGSRVNGYSHIPWRECNTVVQLLSHWPLWAIYVAHFTMNWSNYIIMNWFPTYMVRYLGADKYQIMFTALPYLLNSLVSIGSGHLADRLILNRWNVLSVRRLMTCIGLLAPGILILFLSAANNIAWAVLLISISMGFSACNSAGHLSNHSEVAPNHAGISFAISNTLATIPGILVGPLTAELVVQSGGRWFPVFILAGLMNLVGAVVYVGQSSASQLL
jgi:MFS family permease